MAEDYPPCIVTSGRSAAEPVDTPAGPSVRSPFVDGLHRLSIRDTRARLAAVRKAVHSRIDALRDPDARHALLLEADRIDRDLLHAARDATERLAQALAVSHGEPRVPSAHPERRIRR